LNAYFYYQYKRNIKVMKVARQTRILPEFRQSPFLSISDQFPSLPLMLQGETTEK
jgi:hypothetical protein